MDKEQRELYNWLCLFVADHTKVILKPNCGLCSNIVAQVGHNTYRAFKQYYYRVHPSKCFPDENTYLEHKHQNTLYEGEQLQLRKELANKILILIEEDANE